MIYTLQSGDYTAKIDSFGAELKSFYNQKSAREMIWCGDKTVWKGTSPILFPIIGPLKDKSYAVGGLLYRLERHGFARLNEWTGNQLGENAVVFTLSATEETKQLYPYDFVLTTAFTLTNNRLEICFTLRNPSSQPLNYMLGTHTAFATEESEGLNECALRFDKSGEHRVRKLSAQSGLLTRERTPLFAGASLPLSPEIFVDDALIFDKPLSKTVFLDRVGQPSIRVDFDDFTALGVWTAKDNRRFVCIEPWTAVPAAEGDTIVLSEKPNITRLDGDSTHSYTYSLTEEI